MKHDLKVTLFLILLFLTAQIIGLFVLNLSIDNIGKDEEGNINVNYSEPITGRPEMEGHSSFIYLLIMIFVGTLILLGIIKLKLFKVWKAWFFLAVFGALSVALSVLIPKNNLISNELAAMILSLIITYFKLYKPNAIIHNISEVFMYAGITVIITPILNVFWASMLLLAISIYDAIAVWKLKHMITLATEQAKQNMFAGLLLPYESRKKEKIEIKERDEKKEETIKTKIKIELPKDIKKEEKGVKSAILGGGDIAFPLIFAGTVLTWLIESGVARHVAFFEALIISIFLTGFLVDVFQLFFFQLHIHFVTHCMEYEESEYIVTFFISDPLSNIFVNAI